MLAASHELANCPAGRFLHGNAFGFSAFAERFLLAIGEAKCHGHAPMVSVRYRPELSADRSDLTTPGHATQFAPVTDADKPPSKSATFTDTAADDGAFWAVRRFSQRCFSFTQP